MTEKETAFDTSTLNTEQLAAAEHTQGPLLILAGAGTGKTRVLTHRIANILIRRLAMPSQILAVTFTNKAAREMQNRVTELVGQSGESMYLGTFHSIAAKILRQYASFLGFTSDFTIIGYDDQLNAVKKILKVKNLDPAKFPPKLVLYHIGRFKDKACMPDKVPGSMEMDFNGVSLTEIYRIYQSDLRKLNAMDFGDLLLYCIELFNNNLEVLEIFQRKFRYILVDEYQDTNVAQYLWLRMLAQEHNNICCVGDDDQSIYGWRGAEVTNILRFDKDFKDAKVVRLEQNYRSTQCILKAASGIISINSTRHEKELWTDQNEGELIKVNNCYDDREEARFVADEIDTLHRYKKTSLKNIAILVRAGYQTRSFEESLNFLQIPYNVVGGTKFYERMEIKDVLAYIRFLVNPQDLLAFERMISTPKRGIGQVSLQKVMAYAEQQTSGNFIENALRAVQNGVVRGRASGALNAVLNQFLNWQKEIGTMTHAELIEKMLTDSGYIGMYKQEATEQSRERIDNIKELLTNLSEYESLKEYLEHISLIMDNDTNSAEDRVSVMTIHAAKGLEFDTVFLCGWEEGIFPSQKAIEEGGMNAIEEERRLAYVAITRAMKRLYITTASNRRIYGNYQTSYPSRFLDEIPQDTYEILNEYSPYYKGSSNGDNSGDFNDYNQYAQPKIVDTHSTDNHQHGIKCGDKVKHIKFGVGTVVSVTAEQAVIVFERVGLKRLMVDYLQKL